MISMNSIIVNNIKALMRDNSIKQVELATTLGVSKQTMSKMLGGDRMLNAVELATIARALHTSIDKLVRKSDNTLEVNAIRAFMGEVNTQQARQGLEIADEIADLICFHAKCRKNGESMMQPWEA